MSEILVILGVSVAKLKGKIGLLECVVVVDLKRTKITWVMLSLAPADVANAKIPKRFREEA